MSRKYVDTLSLAKKSLVRSELRGGGSVLDDVSEEDCDLEGGAITLPSITHKSQAGARHTRTLSKIMADSE